MDIVMPNINGPNAGGPREFSIPIPLPARVGQLWRWSRHEVAFNTAWRDRFPDQALRVSAGIPRKHASGGLWPRATTARGVEPSRQCSKPGSLRPGAS